MVAALLAYELSVLSQSDAFGDSQRVPLGRLQPQHLVGRIAAGLARATFGTPTTHLEHPEQARDPARSIPPDADCRRILDMRPAAPTAPPWQAHLAAPARSPVVPRSSPRPPPPRPASCRVPACYTVKGAAWAMAFARQPAPWSRWRPARTTRLGYGVRLPRLLANSSSHQTLPAVSTISPS
jgi:hypothetical protein